MQEYRKKILGSGHNTTLIISNDEMKDILKIVKSVEDSGFLLEGVSETIKNEPKEQKRGFLSMLTGTLGQKPIRKYVSRQSSYRAGEGTARDLYLKKKLILPHPLTNFETQIYQDEPRFNWVYSRYNLPDKIEDGAHVINLDEYSDIGAHWIALYVNTKTVTTLIALGLNIFQNKSKNLLITKT